MNEEIKRLVKSVIMISIIALVSISIVASVALITMCVQSNRAMEASVEWFDSYMSSDYEYGEINQTTDVKVGE